MAAPKRKTSASKKKTTAKKAAPKKTTTKKVTKKSTARKATAKKTTTKKAPKVKAKKKTTRARKQVMKSAAKAKVTTTGKWASLWSLSIALVGIITMSSLLGNPEMRQSLQANLLAQFDGTVEVTDSFAPSEPAGILLSYQPGGDNEKKLTDIFQTVFPDIMLEEVNYTTERGQNLMAELGVTELPNIYFEKAPFEQQTLSEVVEDLFELRGDYYALNVSLVNPSYQVYLGGEPSTQDGVILGNDEAPMTAYVYSDPRCQHCRVNERNNQREFTELIEEGLLRMVFMDLPQDTEGTFHATALNCLYREQQDMANYLDLRDKIFRRANLTKAYTTRELRRLGVNYDSSCDEAEYRRIFRERKRIADAEGVTGIPAIYIGQTGGSEYLRVTGSHDYSVYQQIFDQLLGTEEGVE